MKGVALSTIVIILTLAAGPIRAQESASADARVYADVYGEAMRDWAEGRNESAIAKFYQAYALRPSPHVLKMVVRLHDFMGHCSAAKHQLEFFESTWPGEKPPLLQICRRTGVVEVSCRDSEEAVVNDAIRVVCGNSVELPPGRHTVRSARGGPTVAVNVTAGETRAVRVEAGAGVSAGEIPRLEDDERYIVIRSPDGLYQLWVRTPLRDDPDMNGEGPAGFTILKGSDGLYHITTDRLKEVAPKKSRSEPDG